MSYTRTTRLLYFCVLQEVMAFPENEAYEFKLFQGQTIRLEPDGSFYVDGTECTEEAFMGAHMCEY